MPWLSVSHLQTFANAGSPAFFWTHRHFILSCLRVFAHAMFLACNTGKPGLQNSAPVAWSHWTSFLAGKIDTQDVPRFKWNNVCWVPNTQHSRCLLMVTYELYTSSKDRAKCHLLCKIFFHSIGRDCLLLPGILTAFCLKWQFSMSHVGLSNLLKARDKLSLTFVSLGYRWQFSVH